MMGFVSTLMRKATKYVYLGIFTPERTAKDSELFSSEVWTHSTWELQLTQGTEMQVVQRRESNDLGLEGLKSRDASPTVQIPIPSNFRVTRLVLHSLGVVPGLLAYVQMYYNRPQSGTVESSCV